MKSTLLALATTAAITAALFAQGDLNPPPGGPTATMKTLDQLEARTAIPPTPSVPSSVLHYLILFPGSYYLTGNITVSSGDGIVINSDDVSIDLNGFTIKSIQTNGSSGCAINVTGDRSRITIKNGSIRSGSVRTNGVFTTVAGFSWGIHSTTSINQSLISDVHISGTTGNGIELNEGGIIERCTVSNCGGTGILATEGTVTHSTSTNNGLHGFHVQKGSVTHCTATKNLHYGINAPSSIIDHCIANNNTDGIDAERGSVSHSTANNNRFTGIWADLGTVTSSTVTGNGHSGINADGGSVTHCRATANLQKGIDVGNGVVSYCVAAGNASIFNNIYKQIYAAPSPNGQRIGCIPVSE